MCRSDLLVSALLNPTTLLCHNPSCSRPLPSDASSEHTATLVVAFKKSTIVVCMPWQYSNGRQCKYLQTRGNSIFPRFKHRCVLLSPSQTGTPPSFTKVAEQTVLSAALIAILVMIVTNCLAMFAIVKNDCCSVICEASCQVL